MRIQASPIDFLRNYDDIQPWVSDSVVEEVSPQFIALGLGAYALEVAFAVSTKRPTHAAVKTYWQQRHGNSPSPLLLVVAYEVAGSHMASICGATVGSLTVIDDLELSHVERLAEAALLQPDRHFALRHLNDKLSALTESPIAGIRNSGLFALHELLVGVPARADWARAAEDGRSLLLLRGRGLLEGLGHNLEQVNATALLMLGAEGDHRAIGVVLDEVEQFDAVSGRYNGATPAAYGLALAQRLRLPWVFIVRGKTLRLYPADPNIGVGRRGQTQTFVEADLDLLKTDSAGFLGLVFSEKAIAKRGAIYTILDASKNFAADLSSRLRERIYQDVVPPLAITVAHQIKATTPRELQRAYHCSLLILFRLLFVAYAEDRGLFPDDNAFYVRKSLKQLAKDFADQDISPVDFDSSSAVLWNDVRELWRAIDRGNSAWGLPAYNGGLFTSDPRRSPDGALIEQLTLSDRDFGPTLFALIVDTADDGAPGPVDFRTLSLREFGTIYEGLLEGRLSVAPENLVVDKAGRYVATQGESPQVRSGQVYFHDRTGARNASGAFFTKQFAVEHLLDAALEPALAAHLERLARTLEIEGEVAAAEAFFDFRVADIAMGSGHFLIAAVDRIEVRLSQFLTENQLPQVLDELALLYGASVRAAGKAGAPGADRSALLRRQIARRCVYGIDQNYLAVELARLSLWIHTFVPGLPLSFLDHGLVQGNSLTGIATVSDVLQVLDPAAASGQASLFGREIEEALTDAKARLAMVARAAEATKVDVDRAAADHAAAMAAAEGARELFDAAALSRLEGFEAAFDVTSARRLATTLTAQQTLTRLNCLHFPVQFPEVFNRANPGFDCLIGNPPWEEAVVERLRFWTLHRPGLRTMKNVDQQRVIGLLEKERPELLSEYEKLVLEADEQRRALLSGAFPGMGQGDPDLYKAFLWRFWQLCRPGGKLAIVVPRSAFAQKGLTAWRQTVFSNAHVDIVFLKNESQWIFDGVNPGLEIALCAVDRNRQDRCVGIRGTFRSLSAYEAGKQQAPTMLTVELLEKSDPDALCVPVFENELDLELYNVLIAHQGVGSKDRRDFEAAAVTELHVTNDGKLFFTGRPDDQPVYNHLNVDHFSFDTNRGAFQYVKWDRVVGDLQKRKASASARSPFAKMGVDWIRSADTLPARHPRLVFRGIIHASNPRKVWMALAPAGTLLTNAAPYLIFPRGGVLVQAYVLGILNSATCDWYGHRRIVLNLNFFIFNCLPVPEFDRSDARAARIAALAAGLALRDGRYEEWESVAQRIPENLRIEAIAELDAIASLLYTVSDKFLPRIFDRPTRSSVERVRYWRSKWQ
jgi:hypothetical protein